MKLPKVFTTVTPLSRTLVLILFILLPILGFIFGMFYQRSIIIDSFKPNINQEFNPTLPENLRLPSRVSNQNQPSNIPPTTVTVKPSVPFNFNSCLSAGNDKYLCQFLDMVTSDITKQNLQELISFQNQVDWTCEDKDRISQGLPLFHSEKLCTIVPDGTKTKGLYLGWNQSEGTTYSPGEYLTALTKYFTENKPWSYLGYVFKNDKGQIVYINQTKEAYNLFAIPFRKYGTVWKIQSVIIGGTTNDYKNLDTDTLIKYIQ